MSTKFTEKHPKQNTKRKSAEVRTKQERQDERKPQNRATKQARHLLDDEPCTTLVKKRHHKPENTHDQQTQLIRNIRQGESEVITGESDKKQSCDYGNNCSKE